VIKKDGEKENERMGEIVRERERERKTEKNKRICLRKILFLISCKLQLYIRSEINALSIIYA